MVFGIFNLGATELIVILVIVLLIFGPKKLPDMGRAIGEMLANFRSGAKEDKSDGNEAKKDDK